MYTIITESGKNITVGTIEAARKIADDLNQFLVEDGMFTQIVSEDGKIIDQSLFSAKNENQMSAEKIQNGDTTMPTENLEKYIALKIRAAALELMAENDDEVYEEYSRYNDEADAMKRGIVNELAATETADALFENWSNAAESLKTLRHVSPTDPGKARMVALEIIYSSAKNRKLSLAAAESAERK